MIRESTNREMRRSTLDDAQSRLVLVVEDDEDLRGTLAALLVIAGYRVETARDGSVAWDRLQLEPVPHAVVVDLNMPRIDGFALRDRMRAEQRTVAVPIVFCTARDVAADQLQGCALVRKPFDTDHLLSVLSGAMRLP